MWIIYIELGGVDIHGAIVNVFDCNIIVSKFELQPSIYVYFRVNDLKK